jgi:hypothetical protein
LSLIRAAELLRYMSPLYPKDKTLMFGQSNGSRSLGHSTGLELASPPLCSQVRMGSPSTPWTRTRLEKGKGCFISISFYPWPRPYVSVSSMDLLNAPSTVTTRCWYVKLSKAHSLRHDVVC